MAVERISVKGGAAAHRDFYRGDMRPHLSALADQRYALEVLDQLSRGPQDVSQLASALRLSQRAIALALRALIVDGLVCSDHAGTWDCLRSGAVPRHLTYRHTVRGDRVVSRLSSFAVWQALTDS